MFANKDHNNTQCVSLKRAHIGSLYFRQAQTNFDNFWQPTSEHFQK